MWDPAGTVAIVNPSAGGGKVGRSWSSLESRLTEHLGPVRFVHTKHKGHASALATEAVHAGAHTVLSMGGDGTHNEVVNGIMAANPEPGAISLGLLPSGTGGDLCRMIPNGQRTLSAAKQLPQAQSAAVDVGCVTYQNEESGQEARRHFINVASFGLSGMVDRLVDQSANWLGGTLTFYTATLRALATYQPATVQLTLDGKDIGTHTITTVLACNARYAGGGMLFAPKACMADGMLDVVIIRYRSVAATVGLTGRIYKGTHAETDLVEVHRGQVLTATPTTDTPAYMDIDGEAPGYAPARFSVLPKAIRLIGVSEDAL